MPTKLSLNRLRNLSFIQRKSSLFKLLNHLTTREPTKIPSFSTRRTLRLLLSNSLKTITIQKSDSLAVAELATLRWLPFVAALGVALLIQIATNLHNDVADYLRGSDTPDRLGPARATARGWLGPGNVQRAAWGCFLAALLLGLYLITVAGWPVFVLGLLSLLAGAAYSGGPWPISNSPLGELFVYLFFGLAAAAGSYFLQTLTLGRSALFLGSALGMLAAAVLVVNNYRDRAADARSGRRTLAVLLGARFSRLEYALLLLLPFPLVALLGSHSAGLLWLPWLLLPWALYLIYRVYTVPVGVDLNAILAQTAGLQLVFALVLSAGLLMGPGSAVQIGGVGACSGGDRYCPRHLSAINRSEFT